jgi:hypothetical protein
MHERQVEKQTEGGVLYQLSAGLNSRKFTLEKYNALSSIYTYRDKKNSWLKKRTKGIHIPPGGVSHDQSATKM